MKNWLKKFDDAMVAATFAEAGEFETARETLKERRTIMLALTGKREDEKAFRFAINACQRIRADLEILYSGQKKGNVPGWIQSELRSEGIEYSFIKVDGCIRLAVQKHTSRRSDILFVVVESSDRLNMKCKKSQKLISKSWKDLKCPLVVVSELASA
ncbi:MAG: hypothetical protein JSW20_10200 [Nitrospiraceae bacterium]|nr:MAG: hypothetical protein JSW20_10200 [Nitrospiraceae bacterium]